MAAFPLNDVKWQKIILPFLIKSLQEAWRWMFYILAGLF